MSRVSDVLKNRNKIEKARKLRRKNEMSTLRERTAFKAKLYDQLRHAEIALNDPDIDALIIEIPDKYLAQFSASIYTEDLAGYDVQQVDGVANRFYLRRKMIAF